MPGPYIRRSTAAIDSLGDVSSWLDTASQWIGKVADVAGRVSSGARQVQDTATSAQAQLPNVYRVVKNPQAAAYGASVGADAGDLVKQHPVLVGAVAAAAAYGAWHLLRGRR